MTLLPRAGSNRTLRGKWPSTSPSPGISFPARAGPAPACCSKHASLRRRGRRLEICVLVEAKIHKLRAEALAHLAGDVSALDLLELEVDRSIFANPAQQVSVNLGPCFFGAFRRR